MDVREYSVAEIRTSKGDSKWWHTHQLSLVTCISKASNNRRFEATVTVVSVGKRDQQTKLTKPHQALSSLMGPLSIKVKLRVYKYYQ
jgi:hypothetical protein